MGTFHGADPGIDLRLGVRRLKPSGIGIRRSSEDKLATAAPGYSVFGDMLLGDNKNLFFRATANAPSK